MSWSLSGASAWLIHSWLPCSWACATAASSAAPAQPIAIRCGEKTELPFVATERTIGSGSAPTAFSFGTRTFSSVMPPFDRAAQAHRVVDERAHAVVRALDEDVALAHDRDRAVRVGALHLDDVDVRLARGGDERLLAVDDVLVALLGGDGVELLAEEAALLVDRERAELPGGELREVLLLQRVGAGPVDDVDEVAVEHERHPGRGARRRDDLDRERGGERAAAQAAVLLRHEDAEQARLAERLDAVAHERALAVVLLRARRDLGLRHLDRQVPDLPLLVPEVVPLELGLHRRSSASVAWSRSTLFGGLQACKPR